MTAINDPREVYENCIQRASDMIRLLVDDFDVKYNYEPIVRSVTLHIAQLYYLLETNQNFKLEREEMAMKTQQLLEGLSQLRGEKL